MVEIERILAGIDGVTCRLHEPMAGHTSFRAGGCADIYMEPSSTEALAAAVGAVRRAGLAHLILGNGTNVLFRDEGFRGAVISTSALAGLQVQGDMLLAGAGAKLSAACAFAHNSGLVGLEFAGGIPGSVGGAIYMNAGAYGGEIAGCLASAQVLRQDGSVAEVPAASLGLGYRHSSLQESGDTVLSGTFALERGDVAAAREQLAALNARRREKQPLELPSAGSTFKRPEGHFAAALIEECGLKGRRIGGAQVSEKHAGFIVNAGGATAADILALMALVAKEIWQQKGVRLEPEVRVVGKHGICTEG